MRIMIKMKKMNVNFSHRKWKKVSPIAKITSQSQNNFPNDSLGEIEYELEVEDNSINVLRATHQRSERDIDTAEEEGVIHGYFKNSHVTKDISNDSSIGSLKAS